MEKNIMEYTYLTLEPLKTLVVDMRAKSVEKEHFSFVYARMTFDCIFAFCANEYELLIGIHSENFGLIIPVNERFVAALSAANYYALRDVLKLTAKGDGFTSNIFLKLLSSKIPCCSSGVHIASEEMIKYVKCRHVDEADKIYFKGWNDHTKDGRVARNFDKTEFYFGKTVADYCRVHNISSLWTDIISEKESCHMPW